MKLSHGRVMLSACALAGSVALLLSSPAGADVVSAAWANSTTYSYEIVHMPDFDQRRMSQGGAGGLPNDGGMYCVPTCFMNMFAYAGNHGFPAVAPGGTTAWWQAQSNYGLLTGNLTTLGTLMGTDPTDGTSGSGAFNGGQLWLLTTGMSGKLVVKQYSIWGGYFPNHANLFQNAASGKLVSFCYGRWNITQNGDTTVTVGSRASGHCVTLTKAQRSGSAFALASHDPADDPDAETNPIWGLTQSPFGNVEYSSVKDLVVIRPGVGVYVLTALNYDPNDNDGRIRLVDTMFTLGPKAGWSWKPSGEINFMIPSNFTFGMPDNGAFQYVGGLITDLALTPDVDNFVVIDDEVGGPTMLKYFDTVSETATDLAEVPGAEQVVIGRRRQVYVLSNGGDRVDCFNIDVNPIEVVTGFPPAPCVGMEYDDATDQLVLLSPTGQSLFMWNEDLSGTPARAPFPPAVVASGDGAVTVNPQDGSTWFYTEASDVLYRVTNTTRGFTFESISVPAVQSPESISIDDAGHVFLVSNNAIVELARNPDTDRYEQVIPGEFDGFVPDGEFFVTRCRSNVDPAVHDTPGWNNILPSDLAPLGEFKEECLADLTNATSDGRDGVVDVFDLIVLLQFWGQDGLPAPLAEPADTTDVFDLLEMLTSWGPCP